MQPKVLAFHLPQYHTFPENDEWWGEGFTEWVNVKKARPRFDGHNQPKIPLNNNYYDLSKYETRKWQAELAQKYGIYGFCYYHYWFNGKLLMEKPLEALLTEKDITLPFCFCWANEPWTRAWDGHSKEVIMPQEYGGKEDWKKHIDYLLPFFKDSRYIKIKNQPMLIIYRTNNIDCCDDMIELWDNVCRKNGFKGIYIVEERNNFQNTPVCPRSKAVLDFEPTQVVKWEKKGTIKAKHIIQNHILKKLLKRTYDIGSYDDYWKKTLKQVNYTFEGKKHFLGGFVNWDNTPRRENGGLVCIGNSVTSFEKYFKQLFDLAKSNNSEFIFINAWNEWAEGAYLEPDTTNEFGYLEAIKSVVSSSDLG